MIENRYTEPVKMLSYAKVNLFLQVLNKRADRYHNIVSLFQAVDLADTLDFELQSEPGVVIEIHGRMTDLPIGTDNLIAKAYSALAKDFSFDKGLKVRIDKRIPIGAGLGGGSSNAATTLLASNTLFDLKLSEEKLNLYALSLGSDVPFFLSSGQAMVRGRGELIEQVALPTDYFLVLVYPGIHCSTTEAYESLDAGLTKRAPHFSFQNCRTTEELLTPLRSVGNDFEQVQYSRYPVLGRVHELLERAGASLVRLSGSGSTVFGLFTKLPVLGRDFGREQGWTSFTVRPCVLSR